LHSIVDVTDASSRVLYCCYVDIDFGTMMPLHAVPCDPVAKFGSVQKCIAETLQQSLMEFPTAVVESQTAD